MIENKSTISYLPIITERLKSVGIYKLVLFGSMSKGDYNSDSDIDLLVVKKDEHLPVTYKEKSDIYMRISNQLNDIISKVPIDLIVYTKPMYRKFNEIGSLFSKEIAQKGIVIYEDDH
jgi:predicted nucleotidyltransferase